MVHITEIQEERTKQMELNIRKEEPKDFKTVFNLIEKAFEQEQMSDHKEQFLVERLRKSKAFSLNFQWWPKPKIKLSDIFY